MGIVAEDIAMVRDATDLVALVSRHLALKRTGNSWVGLCPFHGEKTPSFSVSADKGFYHCFGCGKSGDAIAFCMEMEHLDFVAAVESLAAAAGIRVRYDDKAQGEGRRERSKLVDTMEAAVGWYHDRLLSAPDAGAARSYLRSRGFDSELVKQYRLGWAPDDWDALARSLRSSGSALERVGLVFVNRRGRKQDFFRNRVLFPIFDAQGAPVSFGARILPGGDGAKYRNTAETPLYHKSRVLYGLNWAKASIVNNDQVIICEGYTDVIGFAVAGMNRAVATCGTALTEDHVKMLRKFARRIVLAFDPDAAGRAAADRVYAWEHTHDIDVSVVDLPAGEDPADLARSDPQKLRDAVERARPFLAYRIDRVLAQGDFSSAEGRARVAQRALGVIAEHPSELVRDPYVMEVADRCRVDPDQLRSRLARGDVQPASHDSPGNDQPEEAPKRQRPRRPASSVETEALRHVVHGGGEVADLIAAVLFRDPHLREAFEALVQASFDAHQAAAMVGPDAQERIASVSVEPSDAEALDVVTRLVAEAGRNELRELERDARQADDPLSFAPAISWLKLKLEELQADPVRILVDERELVTWLSQQVGGSE